MACECRGFRTHCESFSPSTPPVHQLKPSIRIVLAKAHLVPNHWQALPQVKAIRGSENVSGDIYYSC